MADPTPEELADAGVEIGVVSESEPERAPFKQTSTLPDEPKSDVKIVLDSGEAFRERMIRTPLGGLVAEPGAPDGFNFSFSNALLADDGSVAKDPDGNWRIVPPEVRHELRLTGEDMGALGEEGVKAALQQAREVAAAKARAYFAGMAVGEAVFASRLS